MHEVMSAAGIWFRADDPLSNVIDTMAAQGHSCALVCNDGKPTGIITAGNILRLLAANNASADFTAVTATQAMTPNPLTISSELDLAEAMQLARSHKQYYLVVVDVYQLLVGVVSLGDMLDAFLKLQKPGAENDPAQHWLSLEDSLTGLPNRRAMEIDLKQTEAIAKRRDESYALAMIDLDFLTRLNTSLGREAGDQALAHVASIIRNRIRASDKAFRYGGEEFVYLMPGTAAEGALIAADRLRQAIETSGFKNPDGLNGGLTVSIGLAARKGGNWQEMLKLAENALYKA
ncbi:MAG: diguanylate cyclase, partial [Pseudohongiellaceae bacterium]